MHAIEEIHLLAGQEIAMGEIHSGPMAFRERTRVPRTAYKSSGGESGRLFLGILCRTRLATSHPDCLGTRRIPNIRILYCVLQSLSNRIMIVQTKEAGPHVRVPRRWQSPILVCRV